MRLVIFALTAVLAIAGGASTAMETLAVSATHRERIEMPPDVTFEARLEEVSQGDTPSKDLGWATGKDAGNPPFIASLWHTEDGARTGPGHVVHASLQIGEQLFSMVNTPASVSAERAQSAVPVILVNAQAIQQPADRLIGEFVYFADAATFTECGSDVTYPVATEGAYPDAEQAYGDVRAEPGAPVVAVVNAHIAVREAMEGGLRDMVVIDRLAGFVPGLTCDRALADSEVGDAHWRILSIGGDTLDPVEGDRAPHIMFRSGEAVFTSSIGCNTINGGYTLDGSSLTLQPGPMTLMACPPPFDEVERAWVQGITSVSEALVTGPTLELRDADGETVAFLENVALR